MNNTINGQELERQFESVLPDQLHIGMPIYAVRTQYYGFHDKRYYLDETQVKEIGIDKKGWYITTKSNVRNSLTSVGYQLFFNKTEAQSYLDFEIDKLRRTNKK